MAEIIKNSEGSHTHLRTGKQSDTGCKRCRGLEFYFLVLVNDFEFNVVFLLIILIQVNCAVYSGNVYYINSHIYDLIPVLHGCFYTSPLSRG